MKKTLSVNLNKKKFNIDEDAYELLKKYLDNLNNYFRNEDGKDEIVGDFESRISELFYEKIAGGGDIIDISDVEHVIKQMGNPSDFDYQDSDKENKTNPYLSDSQTRKDTSKKFYRNPKDKMIGGVCSGIAAYFGWDSSLIRIVAIIVVFLGIPFIDSTGASFWVIVGYIMLWIILPQAITAEQQLRMRGEKVNLKNIGNVVASDTQKKSKGADNNNDYYEVHNEANHNYGGCIGNILKIFLIGIVVIISLPVLFAVIVMFSVLFGFAGVNINDIDTSMIHSIPKYIWLTGCISLGIPLVSLLYMVVSHLLKWRPLSKWLKISTLILWIISVVFLIISVSNSNTRECFLTHNNWEAIQGDKNYIVESLKSDNNVENIVVRGSVNLDFYSSDNTDNQIKIEGDSNILKSHMGIYLIGKELFIESKNSSYFNQTKNYSVYLNTDYLKKIDVRGSSKVELKNAKRGDSLAVRLWGTSLFAADTIDVENFQANLSGASKANIAGKADNAQFVLSGAGTLSSAGFEAANVDILVSGASKLTCMAKERIKGKVSGASKVVVEGSPKTDNIKLLGASNLTINGTTKN